ncbi:hypothetical protein FHETE_3373 [Fusarium heterosporum]|uniref:Uncharacterized protein n=1 Tax=Fusarium heterosporum TaxID=42747 RepID=A0A8H5WXB2_FUSHE|nr:hypothetical protein FHETE_3373 [Fusarium heterosporum]
MPRLILADIARSQVRHPLPLGSTNKQHLFKSLSSFTTSVGPTSVPRTQFPAPTQPKAGTCRKGEGRTTWMEALDEAEDEVYRYFNKGALESQLPSVSGPGLSPKDPQLKQAFDFGRQLASNIVHQGPISAETIFSAAGYWLCMITDSSSNNKLKEGASSRVILPRF